MKEKLINLIKDYRAESEKRWTPVGGYKNEREHGQSDAYDKCANDLEELVRQLTSKSNKIPNRKCPECDGMLKHFLGCQYGWDIEEMQRIFRGKDAA